MAGFAELTLEQGANFTTTVTVNGSDGSPTNLLNYTGAAQIRKSYYSANTTAEFTTTINSPNTGVILLSLTAPVTANIAAGRYVYDVAIKDTANTVTRVLEGIVNVIPQVTKF